MLRHRLADRWSVPLETVEAMPMALTYKWVAYFELKKEDEDRANGR